MSDEKIIKPDKQPLHPFSKMNRAATRQEAVNAAVNAAQGVYTQLANEHDRIMGEVGTRLDDDEEEFRIFREVMSRQVRELKRYSFSYIVVSALRYDWLRFKLWVIELFRAKPLKYADLRVHQSLDPVAIADKPATNAATPGATCGCDWEKGENCLLCAPPKAKG